MDEQGVGVSQTATITVTGTNDAPILESALAFTVAEDDTLIPIMTALAGASDIDQLDSLSVENIQGLEGLGSAVEFNAEVGQFFLNAEDAAFQSLAVGDTRDIEITFDVVDGNGGVVQQTLTITITGTNDAPTVDAEIVAAVSEDDAALEINLLAGASDIDAGTVLSIDPDSVTGLRERRDTGWLDANCRPIGRGLPTPVIGSNTRCRRRI